MKRLVLIAFFTLCLSGAAYAQGPTEPSVGPPTIGGGGSEIRGGISINGDGKVTTSGGQVIREAPSKGPSTSSEPSRSPSANSDPTQRSNRDPWEGLRGPQEKGPGEKGPGGNGPRDKEPRDKEPRDRGPRDKEPRDTGPKDPSGPRGGRRDL